MSDRDELRTTIENAIDKIRGFIGWTNQAPIDLADALIADGYRKPRTVTTVEELDALPAWSVVRSEQATIWEKFHGFWAETLTIGRHPSDHIALPATVLYEADK